MLRLSIDLICIIDNKGNFLTVSDSFCDLFGFSNSYIDRIKEEYKQSTIEAAASLKDKDVIDFVNVYVSKSGQEFKISWRAHAYIDDKSLAIGRVIFDSDKDPNT